jgi:uridine kinase
VSVAAGERRLITVDGIDGSGKSTLARRLVAALGESAVLLGVDEFRRPVDWNAGGRTELQVYYEDRYDLGALDGCLRAFVTGGAGCPVPVFDSKTESITGARELDFAGKRWAVVEGVFVARVPAVSEALAIFVDLPRALADARIQRRDQAAGRPLPEVRRRIAQRYFPSHDRYLAERDPRTRAHIVVDTSDLDRPAMTRADWPADPGWGPVRAALETVLLRH